MYAIQNIKTSKFVYATDFRYYPRHQLTSHEKMLTFEDYITAKSDLQFRGCGKNYRVVELAPIKIKRVFDLDEKPLG